MGPFLPTLASLLPDRLRSRALIPSIRAIQVPSWDVSGQRVNEVMCREWGRKPLQALLSHLASYAVHI